MTKSGTIIIWEVDGGDITLNYRIAVCDDEQNEIEYISAYLYPHKKQWI